MLPLFDNSEFILEHEKIFQFKYSDCCLKIMHSKRDGASHIS